MDSAQENSNATPLVIEMDSQWQQDWRFVGGRWLQDDEGVISPPVNLADDNLAFYTPQAYQDFEARFEFRWDIHWTAAGFIFRAQDACHYYVVEFPATGQQTVSEHFWVTISKVDEKGWKEVLHMQMVHGVTSMPHIWHKVRLQVQGDEIRLWVDGRPVTTVRDESYQAAGRVGLLSYSGCGETPKSSFRNLQIRGQAVKAPVWDHSIQASRKWGVVDPEQGWYCRNIVRAANGELLLCRDVLLSNESGDLLLDREHKLVRSADNGQSWTTDEETPEADRHYIPIILRSLPDGCLERYGNTSNPPFKIGKSISQDNGKTWSAWRDVAEVTFPPETSFREFRPCIMLETKDGTLLLFAYAVAEWKTKIVGGRLYQAAPLPWSQSYCLRSTDGGESWSDLINLDGPGVDATSVEPGYQQHGKDELNEVSAAQTRDGRILALIRPMHSPFMWESWSDDDGQSWTPATRGPFPMYACTHSMVSTSSGALLIGGRFPDLAVQVSYDNGMTWHCYGIDTCIWANGTMYEIEPDVVLFVYGGWDSMSQMRYQILRVTPKGLEPGQVVPFGSQIEPDSVSLVPLDTVWRFKTDPQNVGIEQAWFAPETPGSNWAQLHIDRPWNLQGFDDFHGSGWYRTQFRMPEDFDRRKQLWLFFGAVDKEAYVYIDGKKVFEHTRASTGLIYDRLWNMPFKIEARGLLQPGRNHVIAVRVESPFGHGGIWRRVCLVSADSDEMPLKELLLMVEEKHQQ